MYFRNGRGFTILELLIALLMAGIVTSAAMSLYITQHKQLLVQEDITDIQSSARAAAELLANKIRQAGINIPQSLDPIKTYNTDPDTIILYFDANPVQGVQIEFDMPLPSAELRCDGHDVSAILNNDWIYLYDPSVNFGEYIQITHSQTDASHLQHNTMPLSRAYRRGSKVIKVDYIKYYIDQTDPDHPNLMIQHGVATPQVYAENIVNLDFRYFLTYGAVVTETNTPHLIRMVEIDVTARSDKPDPDFIDGYRTRNFSLRVKVRNLGIS